MTIDSVRNHCVRHFPVQNVAKATYREILERRARENQVDFVEGVTTAITPMAFLETVMAKSYEALVESDTRVDVNTGIIAASRLQAIVDSRAGQPNLLELKIQVNRIIDAVRTTVTHEMSDDILQKLDASSARHMALTSPTSTKRTTMTLIHSIPATSLSSTTILTTVTPPWRAEISRQLEMLTKER